MGGCAPVAGGFVAPYVLLTAKDVKENLELPQEGGTVTNGRVFSLRTQALMNAWASRFARATQDKEAHRTFLCRGERGITLADKSVRPGGPAVAEFLSSPSGGEFCGGFWCLSDERAVDYRGL